MLAIYGFHSEFFFRKRIILKKLQFGTILFPYKKCVTEKRTYVNKLKFPLFLWLSCQYPLINYPGVDTMFLIQYFNFQHEKLMKS